MIREDRELLAELKEVTTHVTDFVIAILGATPVNPEAQRELAERLLTTGQLLLDHTNAGHIVNGYVNGHIDDFTSKPYDEPRNQQHPTAIPGQSPQEYSGATTGVEPAVKTK